MDRSIFFWLGYTFFFVVLFNNQMFISTMVSRYLEGKEGLGKVFLFLWLGFVGSFMTPIGFYSIGCTEKDSRKAVLFSTLCVLVTFVVRWLIKKVIVARKQTQNNVHAQ